MSIGILILNWNGRHLLERFLPSVVEHSEGHKIYVVDNASTDDSVAWIKTTYPEVGLLCLNKNLGYAGGYNAAIEMVNHEVLCFLNSDIEVTRGWCDRMAQLFAANPNLAAAQPKILDVNHPDRFEYAGAAGGYLDKLAYPYCRGRIFDNLEEDKGQYDDTVDVDWASGAAFFVQRDLFREIGGFDESYFAHQEEIDLCWRLQLFGYEIKCLPESVVYHLGGGTLSSDNPRKLYLNFRNSLFNIVKNDHRKTWTVILFTRMVLDGAAGLRFVLKGEYTNLYMILKAHRSLYTNMRQLIKKRTQIIERTEIKVTRRVTSIVWKHFIEGRTKFSEL
jgi:GT2 family glycosyltransferase